MIDSQKVLYQLFDVEIHKKTFINYLEVIISEDGTVMYAIPSHQEKLISIACEKLNITREKLNDLCPKEFYFDFMKWLCLITNCIAIWNEHSVGSPNEEQKNVMKKLLEEKLFYGTIPE